jgi:hypothetical protein
MDRKTVKKTICQATTFDGGRTVYHNDFQTPLTPAKAADLEFPLEMVRLGPSASSKQPWRVVLINTACHFYEYKEPGYSDRFPYDI